MNGLIQCELSDSSTNMFNSGNLFIWVLAMLQSYSIEELLTTELSIKVFNGNWAIYLPKKLFFVSLNKILIFHSTQRK